MDRLARVSGVSTGPFRPLVQAGIGAPPHRYLLTRRIERATALLRETALPVTVVGLEAGWSSLGAFSRTFKDVVGESPAAFRDRERAAPHTAVGTPPCFLAAARRPELKIAVSEKRRRASGDKPAAKQKEMAP